MSDGAANPGQRRDNWSRDQVKSLRRKVKNLRAELLIQAKHRQWKDKRYWDGRGLCERLIYRNKRLESLLVELLEENQWLRQQAAFIADRIQGDDWRKKAQRTPDACLRSVGAWIGSHATSKPFSKVSEEAQAAVESKAAHVDAALQEYRAAGVKARTGVRQ